MPSGALLYCLCLVLAAAVLVLFAATAGAGVVAPDFRLVSYGGVGAFARSVGLHFATPSLQVLLPTGLYTLGWGFLHRAAILLGCW